MGPIITILLFVIAAILVFAILGVKVIRHSETMIIERLGRYHRTLQSGLNIIWPILDRSRPMLWRYTENGPNNRVYQINKVTARIDLREALYDFPRQNVITKDNVGLEINALVYFQINDPMRSVYEINNLPDAIEKLTQTTLRNVIGELEFDDCLASRDVINKRLGLILDDATNKWGVKVNRVEIQDITPPADITAAMEKQMRAERDRRAMMLVAEGAKGAKILEAEGIREAEISTAEGNKQAAILRAEGEAQAMERIATAEAAVVDRIRAAMPGNPMDTTNYIVALRYLESLKSMTSGKDNKVIYMPYEASGVLSSLGGIAQMLQKKN
jgi:regulator of protease activity HflC (stomatin/prohibitin superfamily)